MPLESRLPSSKLVSVASHSVASNAGQDWVRFAAAFPDAAPLAPLYKIKNGFVAFEAAFHCLPINKTSFCPGLSDMQSASPWVDDPECPAYGGLMFATNGIGEVFLMKQGDVLHVDLVSEELLSLWGDLESFCRDILSDYRLHTAYDLVHLWQAKNGALPVGSVLSSKIPFVLGGDYSTENLIQMPLLQAVRMNHDLGRQLRGLDEGESVEIKVVR